MKKATKKKLGWTIFGTAASLYAYVLLVNLEYLPNVLDYMGDNDRTGFTDIWNTGELTTTDAQSDTLLIRLNRANTTDGTIDTGLINSLGNYKDLLAKRRAKHQKTK